MPEVSAVHSSAVGRWSVVLHCSHAGSLAVCEPMAKEVREDLHQYRAHKSAAKVAPTRAPGWSSSLYQDAVLYGPAVSQSDHQSGKGL
eukprot:3775973-Amphidinium_carterae.1